MWFMKGELECMQEGETPEGKRDSRGETREGKNEWESLGKKEEACMNRESMREEAWKEHVESEAWHRIEEKERVHAGTHTSRK